MRILFLTSAHNSLSQRLLIELGERGHEIRVCVAATGETMIAAVSREAPDLIIAPMLKIAIPEEVWSRHLCLIVHPGIKGDRGPSSLDWAIANHEKIWGVTIVEAADEFDAGPIWASHEFALEADPPAKSSLYRRQVTEAALRGVLEAIARIESGEFRSGSWQPQKLSDVSSQGSPTLCGCLRPPMRQADRAIDWMRDEKDALSGVIMPVTSKNDVPLMVARGYASLSFLSEAADYMEAEERPIFIYHLGDFDPSGVNAGEKIEQTLRGLAPTAEIHFERIAVTPEQIIAWDLPSRPTKQSDSRAKGFGALSVELDAIDPNQLRALVNEAIERHLPPHEYFVLMAAEESERQAIKAFVFGGGDDRF